VGGRLTRVCLDREGQACGQIRRFLYDHRGFLTQERHPEIGTTESAAAFLPSEIVDPDGFEEIEAADAGNDWTYYTHDARGNVLTKRLEGSTDFDLDYFYDGAGRLIRVAENRGGNPRPLKDFFYGYENSGVDMRRGKLVQARRHNWIRKVTPLEALIIDPEDKDDDAVITEVFKYEGRDGRVSARQTRYNFRGETYAFNLSQTYDQLGNVNALTYPQCVQAADRCNAAAPPRTVTYQYNKGFLTGVPGYATNIAYAYAVSGPQVPAAGNRTVSCSHKTTVRDPHGNETVNYFASSDSRHLWSYGLPFTRCGSGVYDPAGPFLSQEIYEGTAATGTKLRSIYVEYGSDGPGGGEQQEKNHRLRYRKVVYHDDGDRFREVELSDFDGLGNFRQAVVRADFSMADDRTQRTEYNPSRGTLVIDPETSATTGSTFAMPAKNDPWVLDIFSEQRISEDGETAITEYCFDAATGFLSRVRGLAGASRANGDLLTVLEQETGNTGRGPASSTTAATRRARWI